MVGPNASCTPLNSRITAWAMTWAALCRITASASASFFVSSRSRTSPARGSGDVQIDLPAVDFRQDGRLGQPGADFRRHVVSGDRSIELFAAAVGEDYGEHH